MNESPPAPAPPRSRLGPLQKRLLLLVVGLGVLMLADTLYLLANRAADVLGIGYFAVTDLSLPGSTSPWCSGTPWGGSFW